MGVPDHHYRPWLPAEALDYGGLDQALDGALVSWSSRWFSGAAWRRSPSDAIDVLRPFWTGLVGGVAIGLAPDVRAAVASAMLGGMPAQGFRESNDLRLVEMIANVCLNDLKRRLSQIFGLPANDDWREEELGDLLDGAPTYSATIGAPNGRASIQFAVGRDLMVAWTRAGISVVARPVELGSLDRGLGRQTVEVGALVGACALSLTELDALGVGDVLVLDRLLDRPLELAFDGRPVDRRCVVEPGEARLTLELIDPLVG